jgi:pyruvate/2-oxoglutarate dehydrogenase complex dihydrolipoamide acyltransferase (E2) component
MGGMPISRPLLILMAATVALMGLWVVALRPKPVAVKDTPLAATQQISKAKAAAATSDAANAKVQAATGGSAAPAAAAPAAAKPATPAAKAAAKPAAATPNAAAKAQPAKRDIGKIRDAAVVRDLKAGKVVVLLFWNPQGADDLAARGALRDLDLHGGKVVVRVVPITRVAQYESITSGVKVAQSPTTLVIGRKGTTRVIVGLTERREISQAVGDALAGR